MNDIFKLAPLMRIRDAFTFGIPYFCYKHGCVLRSWLRRHPEIQSKTPERCTRSLRKEFRKNIQKGSAMLKGNYGGSVFHNAKRF